MQTLLGSRADSVPWLNEYCHHQHGIAGISRVWWLWGAKVPLYEWTFMTWAQPYWGPSYRRPSPGQTRGEWQASLSGCWSCGQKVLPLGWLKPETTPCRDLLLRLAKLFIQLYMLLGSHSPPQPFSCKTVSVIHCHPSKVSSNALEGRHYSSSLLSLLKNSC